MSAGPDEAGEDEKSTRWLRGSLRVTPETDLGQQQLQGHGHYGPVGWRHLAGAEDQECIALDGEKTRAR